MDTLCDVVCDVTQSICLNTHGLTLRDGSTHQATFELVECCAFGSHAHVAGISAGALCSAATGAIGLLGSLAVSSVRFGLD